MYDFEKEYWLHAIGSNDSELVDAVAERAHKDAIDAYDAAREMAQSFETLADLAVKRANEAADRDDDNANELAEIARESLKMADLAIGLENDAWREI